MLFLVPLIHFVPSDVWGLLSVRLPLVVRPVGWIGVVLGFEEKPWEGIEWLPVEFAFVDCLSLGKKIPSAFALFFPNAKTIPEGHGQHDGFYPVLGADLDDDMSLAFGSALVVRQMMTSVFWVALIARWVA